MTAYSILLMATAGIAGLRVTAAPQKCLKGQVFSANFTDVFVWGPETPPERSCPDACRVAITKRLDNGQVSNVFTLCQNIHSRNDADLVSSGSFSTGRAPPHKPFGCQCVVQVTLPEVLVRDDHYCSPKAIASRWAIKLPPKGTVTPSEKTLPSLRIAATRSRHVSLYSTLLHQRKLAVSAGLSWTDSGSLRTFDFIDGIVAFQPDFVASRVRCFNHIFISAVLRNLFSFRQS